MVIQLLEEVGQKITSYWHRWTIWILCNQPKAQGHGLGNCRSLWLRDPHTRKRDTVKQRNTNLGSQSKEDDRLFENIIITNDGPLHNRN